MRNSRHHDRRLPTNKPRTRKPRFGVRKMRRPKGCRYDYCAVLIPVDRRVKQPKPDHSGVLEAVRASTSDYRIIQTKTRWGSITRIYVCDESDLVLIRMADVESVWKLFRFTDDEF